VRNPNGDASQAPVKRRDRFLAWAFTAGVHLAVLAVLFWASTMRRYPQAFAFAHYGQFDGIAQTQAAWSAAGGGRVLVGATTS